MPHVGETERDNKGECKTIRFGVRYHDAIRIIDICVIFSEFI